LVEGGRGGVAPRECFEKRASCNREGGTGIEGTSVTRDTEEHHRKTEDRGEKKEGAFAGQKR